MFMERGLYDEYKADLVPFLISAVVNTDNAQGGQFLVEGVFSYALDFSVMLPAEG